MLHYAENNYVLNKFAGVVNAVQGAIKPSSIEEAKAAAALIQRCLKQMAEIDALAKDSNYDAIGKILASADFQSIESASTVLVRSDALSADEKVTSNRQLEVSRQHLRHMEYPFVGSVGYHQAVWIGRRRTDHVGRSFRGVEGRRD